MNKRIINPPELLERHAEHQIETALQDTRVVAIVGPRQSGKTTLARHIAGDRFTFLTLDDAQTRNFAENDPTGFVRGLDKAVIDEIQRAPDLLLAIKRSVDEDPTPGRFLITGSADLFAGAISPDSLAGRVETIELYPLSQSEIDQTSPSEFLEKAFNGALKPGRGVHRTDRLIERILAGGYPEALSRSSASRRRDWLTSYARSLAERDVADLATLDKPEMLALLIEYSALMSGRLLNMTELGGRVGVDSKTIDRWLALLEKIFVIRRVRAWHRNTLRRLIKTPILHFMDSGLLGAMVNVDADSLKRDRTALGPLLECFVFTELTKAAALSSTPVSISHYRDKDQMEVDFVLERSPGDVVGIEVKASATVKADDFRGLQKLRDATGKAFAQGVILHDGEQIIPFGDRLVAAPVAALWRV